MQYICIRCFTILLHNTDKRNILSDEIECLSIKIYQIEKSFVNTTTEKQWNTFTRDNINSIAAENWKEKVLCMRQGSV